ncbi:MAG TPA: class I SAM-dependent methyltransferase [Polyangiaceae bacterium]|jgi:SAM-dependent methyltransferase|nr:class I SAM-dependent methyltransferase [Polyangiaceae bacterium]
MSKVGSQRKNKETNAAVLKQAMIRRLPRRIHGSGTLGLPAAPELLEHYVTLLHTTFAHLGRTFNTEETDRMREILRRKLAEGWQASPYAKVVVTYQTDEPPKTSLSYKVGVQVSTIADEYDRWVKTRTPPLFGHHPDSKLMDLARSLGEPKDVPILDIGAGTGRNTLPLAREGFPVDAVELAPSLADILKAEVEKEKLPARVFQGDALDGSVELPENHYKLVVLAEVIASHIRDAAQCRILFEGAAEGLASGGLLVFSAFLAGDGYKPDALARELSQVYWCNLFTRKDFADAMEGLPFDRISDESVYEYEKEHLPAEAWPPTGWFEEWTQGLDMFDVPKGKAPSELRWLVYRKR